jgi:hypothetical protein
VAASEKPFIHFISAEAVVSAESLACVAPLTTNDAPGNVWTTSAEGHSRHFDRAPLTSGLPQLADILRVIRHVSKVPTAVMINAHTQPLNHKPIFAQNRF